MKGSEECEGLSDLFQSTPAHGEITRKSVHHYSHCSLIARSRTTPNHDRESRMGVALGTMETNITVLEGLLSCRAVTGLTNGRGA